MNIFSTTTIAALEMLKGRLKFNVKLVWGDDKRMAAFIVAEAEEFISYKRISPKDLRAIANQLNKYADDISRINYRFNWKRNEGSTPRPKPKPKQLDLFNQPNETNDT